MRTKRFNFLNFTIYCLPIIIFERCSSEKRLLTFLMLDDFIIDLISTVPITKITRISFVLQELLHLRDQIL